MARDEQREPITDERLAEMRRQAEAAARGPWFVMQPGAPNLMMGVWADDGDLVAFVHGMQARADAGEFASEYDNATFIAHAREDVPDLLAELDRLRAELAASHAREVAHNRPIATVRVEVADLEPVKQAMEEARQAIVALTAQRSAAMAREAAAMGIARAVAAAPVGWGTCQAGAHSRIGRECVCLDKETQEHARALLAAHDTGEAGSGTGEE